MTFRAALTVAGFALVVTSAAAPEPDRFTIGVLRRDGIITPVATFDGKRWRQDWPAPASGRDIPITFSAVPSRWWGPLGPRDTWQALTAAPAPLALHVSHPDVYDAQCVPQIGLRTDYRSSEPLPGRDAQPYPKDGLAVSPPHAVERIDILPIGPAQHPVVEAFNVAEASAVVGERIPSHDLARRQREALPITIEAMYAGGDPSARVYYVEAVRVYGGGTPQQPGECRGLTFGAGWFAGNGTLPMKKLEFEVAASSCDRDGLLYMLPLGIVRADGRMFWVAQSSGWNFEQYDVIELTGLVPKMILRAPGGGC